MFMMHNSRKLRESTIPNFHSTTLYLIYIYIYISDTTNKIGASSQALSTVLIENGTSVEYAYNLLSGFTEIRQYRISHTRHYLYIWQSM